MSWVSVGIAGAGLLSSVIGSRRQADAIEGGNDSAIALQNRALDTSIELARPQLEVGNQALGVLAQLYGLQPPTPINFDGNTAHPLYGDGNVPLSEEGIKQAYRDVLGREADRGGLQHYLTRGPKTPPKSNFDRFNSSSVGNVAGTLLGGSTGGFIGGFLGGRDNRKRRSVTFNEFLEATKTTDEYKQRVARGDISEGTDFLSPPQQQQQQQQPIDLNSLVNGNPLIQFTRQQGERDLSRLAAARGINQSSDTLENLLQFNNDVSRAGVQDLVVNPLFQLAGFGPQASNQLNQSTQAGLSNIGQLNRDTANARGSSFANIGNTVGNGLVDFAVARQLRGGLMEFKGTRLTELALAQQNQANLDRGFDLQDRQLNQADQRIQLGQGQLAIAARHLGMSEQEFQAQLFQEVIGNSPDADTAISFLSQISPVAPEAAAQIRGMPSEVFGSVLQDRQLRRDELERQGAKVLGPGQVLVGPDGNEIARGGEKPLTPTERLKVEQAERTEGKRQATQENIANVARSLMESPAIGRVFGVLQSRLPTITSEVADAEADVDRLVALLSLEAREAMKGTGQISDFESKQLGSAATVLSNKAISDEKAMEALQEIFEIFSGVEQRDVSRGSQVGRFTVRSK